MSAEYRVLGPLEVRVAGQVVPVPAGRARVLLATLLLRANRFVSVDELIDRLWEGEPPNPDRAKSTLQMVVTRLRQALGPASCVRTMTGGYRAEVDEQQLDLTRFTRLVEQEAYARALALWRGPALSDVESESLHRDDTPPLAEARLVALEQRLDAELDGGLTRELVGELRSLTMHHPLRERFWAQLMRALHGAGQQAEALATYRSVRSLLGDELGIEPGPELRDLHRAILRQETREPVRGVPRQLPAAPRGFVGRAGLVAKIVSALVPSASSSVVVVSGPPGIGKTALVVHTANLVRKSFPDGQLFMDLRGHTLGQEFGADKVFARFLRSLGIAADAVPAELEEQSALYRSLLADKRVLVVLDNVSKHTDVHALLPGGTKSAVLVTSRDSLRGLVALQGLRSIVVDPLDADESTVLLSEVLPERVSSATPELLAELADACGHWPLALRIAAANLSSRPEPNIGDYLSELGHGTRLGSLAVDGDDRVAVRAAFESAYLALGPDTRGLFRLLGLVAGPDISASAVAALFGGDTKIVQPLLRELVAANLAHNHAAGRYRLHDLISEYAALRAADEDSSEHRRQALTRLLDFYLGTSSNADRILRTYQPSGRLRAAWLAEPLEFSDRRQALDWCQTELINLVVATKQAMELGLYRHAWQIPVALWVFFDLVKQFAEWIEVLRIAVRATREAGDRSAESMPLQGLGLAYKEAGRADEALSTFNEALELRRELGDRRAEAMTMSAIGTTYTSIGKFARAMEHLQAAVEIMQDIGDTQGEAVVLNSMASVSLGLHEFEQSVTLGLRALELVAPISDPVYDGRILDTVGQGHAGMGDHDKAVDAYRRALGKARECRDRNTEGLVLENMGTALSCAGDRAGAVECWNEALVVFEGIDHTSLERIRARLAEVDSR